VNQDWANPVTGPEGWFGRKQAIAVLARWLRSGVHVSLIGGAKIGKTSLLRALAREMGPAAIFLDAPARAGREATWDWVGSAIGALNLREGERACLLVDDAVDRATPGTRGSLEAIAAAASGARGRGVSLCLAGSRRWRDATSNPGCPLAAAGVALRSFPLSAWDRRQASLLIRDRAPEASADQVRRIVDRSGNHPFLLAGLLSSWPDLEGAVERCRGAFESAFASWADEAAPDRPDATGVAGLDARPLLDYLIERGGAVSFDRARRDLRREGLKAEADLLHLLGLIDRRLRGDEATAVLHAGCGLFKDWYREHRMLP